MNVTITGQREDMLANLGLGENKEGFIINNAGIMLFGGKRRDLYIRQVYVTCVLYKGTNKVKIIDRKDFRDGLVQDYENAFKFLQQHLRLEYVIEGGRPREEIPEIPYDALKEALLNAIIHRDYFEIGARVMVEIFDDRVEISNPGELLVDEKEFGKKVISVARNPVLFDIFHRLQLIEKVGTGVQRIIEAIQARKLSIEFYFGSFFSVTFFRPINQGTAPSRHQVGTKSALSWGQVGTKSGLSRDYVTKILEYCLEERAIADIMALFNRKNRTKFKEKFINPLLGENFLTATSPKSKSSKQTYITTSKGKDILESQPPDQITDPGTKLGLSRDYVAKILEYCLEERAIADIMALFNRKNRTKFKEKFINPLLEEDFLTATSPKSKSSKQTYITTSKGKDILESQPPDQITDPGTKSGLSWDQVGTKLGLSRDYVAKILEYCLEERAIADIMALFNRENRTKFKEKFINPLLVENFLTTTSLKSKSSKQAYITTSKGKDILESKPPDQITDSGTKLGLSRDQVGTKWGLSWDYVAKILEYCLEERVIADIMALFNRKNRTKFKEAFINPLLGEDFLTATSPKSKSSKQTYITTSKGKDILESQSPDQITNSGAKSGLSWE